MSVAVSNVASGGSGHDELSHDGIAARMASSHSVDVAVDFAHGMPLNSAQRPHVMSMRPGIAVFGCLRRVLPSFRFDDDDAARCSAGSALLLDVLRAAWLGAAATAPVLAVGMTVRFEVAAGVTFFAAANGCAEALALPRPAGAAQCLMMIKILPRVSLFCSPADLYGCP